LVRERRAGANVSYAAVYPSLRAGGYTIWRPDGGVAATVEVTGGEIASCDWPA
jgi:hypothetical protein